MSTFPIIPILFVVVTVTILSTFFLVNNMRDEDKGFLFIIFPLLCLLLVFSGYAAIKIFFPIEVLEKTNEEIQLIEDKALQSYLEQEYGYYKLLLTEVNSTDYKDYEKIFADNLFNIRDMLMLDKKMNYLEDEEKKYCDALSPYINNNLIKTCYTLNLK